MSTDLNWQEVTDHLESLYRSVDRLEKLFPGRKFTLDGHLVGSIGEVVAAYMFDLTLNPGSTEGSDAITINGVQVEIKLTQGSKIGLRSEPEHLIVLQKKRGRKIVVVYNGPGSLAWDTAGRIQKNGQRALSISRLCKLNEAIPNENSLKVVNAAPI